MPEVRLSKPFRDQGFTLTDDGDCVRLMRGHELVASFSAYGATIKDIEHEAEQEICWQKSGIEFGRR